MHRIPMEYVGMPVKLNLRRLKRKKHHLYARSARSERTIMSINPDEIVEGKCYRAVMKEGPVIFKVTEIKPSAVNTKKRIALARLRPLRTVERFSGSREVSPRIAVGQKYLDRA